MAPISDGPTAATAPQPVGVPRWAAPDDAAVREKPPTPLWALAALAVLSTAALAAACWVAGHLHADPPLQMAARFLHLVALVVGLGSVLAVDWFALLWMLGRRPLPDVLRTACTLQVPIWLGLSGLVVTGLFLRPDLASPLTLLKLGLVLTITLNGLYAHRLAQRLAHCVTASVPRALRLQSGTAATVSQLGWWGATLIGYLNSQS
ncbi:hypothetical protein CP981_18765 [Streptomyces platensis]|uniref:Uncharacterized protein n=1 Tax=Streptomyces platensis TaxID=58346 RepID=A0AAE6NIM0_STRPT|nr:hypothetical protein [Streptomyces platensis]OSY44769.1 hypothetical protein BG653_03791 [Streptomyces platensis]QEV53427.1 hypothetical protein CP981_18765 [Streptomyces platensis]